MIKGEPIHILLVEDDPAHSEAVRRALKAAGMNVVVREAGTLRAYRELAAAHQPDIAILDLSLPDGRAPEVLISPPEAGPFPIVVMSSQGDEQKAVEAMKAGALDYIVKSPEAFAGMPRTVERVLHEWGMLHERKRAAEALRESEEKYRTLFDNAGEAIFVVQDGKLVFSNPMSTRMVGYPSEELRNRPFTEFLHPDDRNMVVERHLKRLRGEELPAVYSFRILSRDGNTLWVDIRAVLINWEGQAATLNFVSDITERKRGEEAVQVSLREKETLLREIHHRVKNNMQVISSLFNLQAGHIKDEAARTMLKEGQLRVRSMALIHEKLYQARDLSKIEFASYLQSLSANLFQFFRVDPGRVRVETDLEQVHLDINTAVPCGLLVNELISNALKHAFPGGRKGTVRVRLRREKDGSMKLRVADDGVGFPEALDFRRSESFGLQIVDLLVGQLEATIELDRKNGTAFTIAFRELDYKART